MKKVICDRCGYSEEMILSYGFRPPVGTKNYKDYQKWFIVDGQDFCIKCYKAFEDFKKRNNG